MSKAIVDISLTLGNVEEPKSSLTLNISKNNATVEALKARLGPDAKQGAAYIKGTSYPSEQLQEIVTGLGMPCELLTDSQGEKWVVLPQELVPQEVTQLLSVSEVSELPDDEGLTFKVQSDLSLDELREMIIQEELDPQIIALTSFKATISGSIRDEFTKLLKPLRHTPLRDISGFLTILTRSSVSTKLHLKFKSWKDLPEELRNSEHFKNSTKIRRELSSLYASMNLYELLADLEGGEFAAFLDNGLSIKLDTVLPGLKRFNQFCATYERQ